MFEEFGIDEMIDAIAVVLEEHGITYENGHRVTTEDLCTLPYKEIRRLFDFCYGSDLTI